MIKNLTIKEIDTLAEDIYRNRVFTSEHIHSNDIHLIQTIFMPLIFADKKLAKALKNCGMLYEYFEKSTGRAINGYPIFASFQVVNIEDTKKIWMRVDDIKKAVNSINISEKNSS